MRRHSVTFFLGLLASLELTRSFVSYFNGRILHQMLGQYKQNMEFQMF